MPKTHPRRYRIESLVQEALAPIVMAALPNRIITLRQVMLNNDFSIATITYTTVNNEGDDNTQELLNQQAWSYRRRLAKSLNMRKTPKLVFVYDSDGAAADKMRAFLEKIAENE